MKIGKGMCILVLLVLLLIPALCLAQDTSTITKFGAFGIGYFSQARPNFQGWAAMGIPLTENGKAISYTDFDVSVVKSDAQFSVAGLRLRYAMSPGIAYRAFKSSSWSVWGLAAPGFNANGEDILGYFKYGGFVHKSFGKGWGVILLLTAEKGEQTDFAPRLGLTKKF